MASLEEIKECSKVVAQPVSEFIPRIPGMFTSITNRSKQPTADEAASCERVTPLSVPSLAIV